MSADLLRPSVTKLKDFVLWRNDSAPDSDDAAQAWLNYTDTNISTVLSKQISNADNKADILKIFCPATQEDVETKIAKMHTVAPIDYYDDKLRSVQVLNVLGRIFNFCPSTEIELKFPKLDQGLSSLVKYFVLRPIIATFNFFSGNEAAAGGVNAIRKIEHLLETAASRIDADIALPELKHAFTEAGSPAEQARLLILFKRAINELSEQQQESLCELAISCLNDAHILEDTETVQTVLDLLTRFPSLPCDEKFINVFLAVNETMSNINKSKLVSRIQWSEQDFNPSILEFLKSGLAVEDGPLAYIYRDYFGLALSRLSALNDDQGRVLVSELIGDGFLFGEDPHISLASAMVVKNLVEAKPALRALARTQLYDRLAPAAAFVGALNPPANNGIYLLAAHVLESSQLDDLSRLYARCENKFAKVAFKSGQIATAMREGVEDPTLGVYDHIRAIEQVMRGNAPRELKRTAYRLASLSGRAGINSLLNALVTPEKQRVFAWDPSQRIELTNDYYAIREALFAIDPGELVPELLSRMRRILDSEIGTVDELEKLVELLYFHTLSPDELFDSMHIRKEDPNEMKEGLCYKLRHANFDYSKLDQYWQTITELSVKAYKMIEDPNLKNMLVKILESNKKYGTQDDLIKFASGSELEETADTILYAMGITPSLAV